MKMVSESLSKESVGWVANRDFTPSVNAVNHTFLSAKGTSSCTDASRFHAACFCRSPQFLHLTDFCWDISLVSFACLTGSINAKFVYYLNLPTSFSRFLSNAGPCRVFTPWLASLKVVARVVPKWVIPWNCFTVRFSVSYVLPLLIWLISTSYTWIVAVPTVPVSSSRTRSSFTDVISFDVFSWTGLGFSFPSELMQRHLTLSGWLEV